MNSSTSIQLLAIVLVVYCSTSGYANHDTCSRPQDRFRFSCFFNRPSPFFRSQTSPVRVVRPVQPRPSFNTRRSPVQPRFRAFRPFAPIAPIAPIPSFRSFPSRPTFRPRTPIQRLRSRTRSFRQTRTRPTPSRPRPSFRRTRPAPQVRTAPRTRPTQQVSPAPTRQAPRRPTFRTRSRPTRPPPVQRPTFPPRQSRPLVGVRPTSRPVAIRRPTVTTRRPPVVTRRPPVVTTRRAPATTRRPPVTTQAVRRDTQQTNGTALGPIREEIRGLLRQNRDLIASFVQIGFHACVGGCDGCIDLGNRHNRGLRQNYRRLRDLHAKHTTDITLADLVVLAAVEAGIEGMRGTSNSNPSIPFRIGRRTCRNPDNPRKGAVFPEGDDPNALQVLMREFNLQRREAVALLGAHSLGQCRSQNSGFQGPWDNTPRSLDNGYYRSLIGSNWQSTPAPGGSTQWAITPGNFNARMMLTADMSLIHTFTVSGTNKMPSCTVASSCPMSGDRGLVTTYSSSEAQFHRDFVPVYVKMLEKTNDSLRNP